MELKFNKNMIITIRSTRDDELAKEFTFTTDVGTPNVRTRFVQNIMWALNEPHLWLYAGPNENEPSTSVIPIFGAMNQSMCGDGTCESRLQNVSSVMSQMSREGMRLFLTPRFGDRNSIFELTADEAETPTSTSTDIIENNEVLTMTEMPTVRTDF